MLSVLLAALLLAQAPPAPPPSPTEGSGRQRANLNSYFSSDDYPAGAIARGAEGTVSFRLQIDAQGRVSACTVTQSSGDAELDSTTCSILVARARYSPARDEEGRAVAGTDSGRVTWRLPSQPDGMPLIPFRTIFLVAMVDGDLECRMSVAGQHVRTDRGTACAGPAGPTIAELLRRAGTGGAVIVVLDFAPADSGIPAADPEWGELVNESSARFSVTADGRVQDCVVTRGATYPPLQGLADRAALCSSPFMERFESSDRPGLRAGVSMFRVFLRRGGREI